MLLSVLAFMQYMVRDRKLAVLLLSGVAAGLSWLTKAPAFFLIPFLGLVLVIELVWRWRSTRQFEWRLFIPLIIWGLTASSVFILFWPAMWVDPIGSLSRVFGYASGYLTEGHESAIFLMALSIPMGRRPGISIRLRICGGPHRQLWSGFVWLPSALIFPNRFQAHGQPPENEGQRRRVILTLGLFALLYIIFMTLGGKKFDRYLLPVFAPLELVAALGWVPSLSFSWRAFLAI